MTSRLIWKVTVSSLIVALMIDLFWAWRVWNVYYETLPHSPDPRTGRVYRDNFHGVAIYETGEEHRRLQMFQYSSEGLVVVLLSAAAINQWRDIRAKSRSAGG